MKLLEVDLTFGNIITYASINTNPSIATMKFSACVLTAGLLLATAAIVQSSALNPIVLNFGVLDDNIISKTSECPNPPDAPIGTIQGLVISKCTKKDYPCHFQINETYIATTTFTCGAAHTRCRIQATMDVMGTEVTIFNVPTDPNETLPVVCNAGDTISPMFPFTIPSESIPGTYDTKMKLFCDDYYGIAQQLEFCRGVRAVVDA